MGCLLHINSYLQNFSSYFCDKQNTICAIKLETLDSAMIAIPLDVGQLNQFETKLCCLVCSVPNCDAYDACAVMLACLA